MGRNFSQRLILDRRCVGVKSKLPIFARVILDEPKSVGMKENDRCSL